MKSLPSDTSPVTKDSMNNVTTRDLYHDSWKAFLLDKNECAKYIIPRTSGHISEDYDSMTCIPLAGAFKY